MEQYPTKQHLSSLQKSILKWLYANPQRSRSGDDEGVPYSDIIHAVAADKTTATTTLRELMRKGLVLLTLPHGRWRRCVVLTEQGRSTARSLMKEERKHRLTRYINETSRMIGDDSRQNVSARRHNRKHHGRRRGAPHPQRRKGGGFGEELG